MAAAPAAKRRSVVDTLPQDVFQTLFSPSAREAAAKRARREWEEGGTQ